MKAKHEIQSGDIQTDCVEDFTRSCQKVRYSEYASGRSLNISIVRSSSIVYDNHVVVFFLLRFLELLYITLGFIGICGFMVFSASLIVGIRPGEKFSSRF